MANVSMLEFRQNAEAVIRRVQRGERMTLTYRGKPVMRLEPLRDGRPNEEDPFYQLASLADSKGRDLTNERVDGIIYRR